MGGDGFSVSLVIPTRGRFEALRRRVPIWAKAGFDDVIVVDCSYDLDVRARTKALCKEHGVEFVPAPRTMKDIRSIARNLGAERASTEWIVFTDDDDDALAVIDREALARSAYGKDWLAKMEGEHIVIHRRLSFLAFGGYPEDMVAAEDMIMSNRARRFGEGGLQGDFHKKLVGFPPEPDDPIGRARNLIWYGYTMALFLARTPKLKQCVIGDMRRLKNLAKDLLRGNLRNIVYLSVAILGRLLSPIHILRVLMQSGKTAFEREVYEPFGFRGET